MSQLNKTISITVDKEHLEEVSGALLHAVLFQRTLGNLQPKEITVLDVVVAGIDSGMIEEMVVKKVRELSATSGDRGVLALVLSENQSRKVNHWFGFGEQHHTQQIPWECWILQFNILTSKTENHKQIIYHNTQNDLNKALNQIIQFTDTNKDHIPPITTADLAPFPFHVLVNPMTSSYNRSTSPHSLAVAAAGNAMTNTIQGNPSNSNGSSQNSYFTAIARRMT
ncbi:hypothetical protein E3P92_02742 [Wallemia ichthyophaga]|nr:hypothetical protein E3P92_02742 [Wallemia ichthyophaga]TIB65536.1 hypothetical protein E3P77_02691 [Wallemia ichthyophaga]